MSISAGKEKTKENKEVFILWGKGRKKKQKEKINKKKKTETSVEKEYDKGKK